MSTFNFFVTKINLKCFGCVHFAGETMPLEDAVELELVMLSSMSTMELRDTTSYSEKSSTLKSLSVQEVMDTRSRHFLSLTDAIASGIFDEKRGQLIF